MSLHVQGVAPLLQVFDMPTSLAFYRDVIGFEVVSASSPDAEGDHYDWVLLRLNDAVIMLNTMYESLFRPARPDTIRQKAHGDASLYFGCPNVDGAYLHFKAHGVAVQEPKVAPYGMKQLYLEDPDGYILCFQWIADGSTESTEA